MLDRFDRPITYLRISVTDRCNLRCTYCMPASGVPPLPHDQILRYEEILDFTRLAVTMGIEKVRLTGGEPLVRKGVVSLVERLATIEGITDLSMTTNGVLLASHARDLRAAGLHRLNVSLDTMDPVRFREITRMGELGHVLHGIETAQVEGFSRIKINTVVQKSDQEPDAQAVRAWATPRGLEVRYIKQMDLRRGTFGVVQGGQGGDCAKCNKLRLTSTGKLKPCLFSDVELDIRELGYVKAIVLALAYKPERGVVNTTRSFHEIGG